MVSFIDGLTNGLRRAYCAIGGLPPEWLVDAYRPVTPGLIQDIGGAINRAICDKPPDYEYPMPTPDFTGGQCPGTTYRVEWTTSRPGLPNNSFSVDRPGPISISRTLDPGDSNASCPEGVEFKRFTLLSGGSPVGIDSGCGVELLSISVTPLFGGADDCGDPPVEYPTPQPITTPVDITYEGDDNVEYNITVPVTFAPVYVDVDGSVRIPISVGDINIKGELVVAPEFKFELGFPELAPGPRPENPELPPPNDPNNGPPDDDDGPEGTIVGVIVRSSQNGPVRSTTLFMESMPDVIAPRCATVRFLCRFGSIRAWTTDQPVKGVNEYVQCPSPFGAIAVEVTPETNWQISSTPIRSRPPAPFLP